MKSCVNKLRTSLTLRIFLITAALLMGACAATYGFIAWATPLTYQAIAVDDMQEKMDALVYRLRDVTLAASGPLFDSFMRDTGAEAVVTDAAGKVVELPTTYAGGHAAYAGENIDVSISAYEAAPAVVPVDGAGEYVVTGSGWSESFVFAGSDQVYILTAVVSPVGVNRTLEALGQVAPYLLALVLLISLLGALFYSRHITRPILRLSAVSQKMADLDFSWPCGEQRQDEIGVLGRNLDALSARLSAALRELQTANLALQADIAKERELEQQRSAFFAAASHELKTPLTVLKGQLAGMLGQVDVYRDRDKYLARSLTVAERMDSLIQEMLTVSRLEKADAVLKQERIDLTALVQLQLEQTEELARQRRQTVAVEPAPGLTVTGDQALLGRAIANLLTNALTYSPPGSLIRVRLAATAEGPLLSVENSNAHLPETALPHLFEAFYRVEGSRNRDSGGSGLGLYLVKMLLDRHHAVCRIRNTDSGVLAEVVFPQ